jgi:hypothetical protein
MKTFKISCHAISEIVSGTVGLTEAQEKTYKELLDRKAASACGVSGIKPLTENMEKELKSLEDKAAGIYSPFPCSIKKCQTKIIGGSFRDTWN